MSWSMSRSSCSRALSKVIRRASMTKSRVASSREAMARRCSALRTFGLRAILLAWRAQKYSIWRSGRWKGTPTCPRTDLLGDCAGLRMIPRTFFMSAMNVSTSFFLSDVENQATSRRESTRDKRAAWMVDIISPDRRSEDRSRDRESASVRR
ncbi:hypothetical protein GSI_01306 [Ganoderma sinense ZZ0214-1]|uniref:Uncharacterized protein n=1 Tax=Ganoderma sinense ZZ0214-1 TaxID=1077348 RepID=A0A2G8SV52_9APHY|nr:hypothetical protein GSI_01306 [Ganoderma sinense ZZ0214-1]